MHVVRMQKGSWDLMARSMRTTKRMLSRFASGEAAPNAGIAIKIARLAEVRVVAVA